MELIYKVNKNLEFKGIETMNEGELQIFVNDKPFTYIDLDNFDFDYESDLSKSFINIINIILNDLFYQNCKDSNSIEDFDKFIEDVARIIKENY